MLRTDTLTVSSLLLPERVRVGMVGEDKNAVIDEVVDLLDGTDGVTDLAVVRADVHRREAVMSTGVGKGLALPHARSNGVATTVAAFATTARPVDYEALDGQPVRLVLLMVGPEEERGAHVRLLSRVSRLMSDEDFRAQLLAAPTPAHILAAFREAEERMG